MEKHIEKSSVSPETIKDNRGIRKNEPPNEDIKSKKDEIKEKLNFVIDFGKVDPCKIHLKSENLPLPRADHQITYRIKRQRETQPLPDAFRIDHYEGALKARKDLKIHAKYSQTIPFQKNLEIFEYVDSDFRVCEIILKGETIGPICQISSKQLLFYKTKNQEHLHSTIEIKNISKVPAELKCDLLEDGYFQINPIECTIQSKRYEYINVKFKPHKNGVFARKVHFLISNGTPLVLELVGIATKNSLDIGSISLKKYSINQEESFGFDSYLSDSLTTRIDVPPFSLNEINIDFGRVDSEDQNRKTMVTTMTNHMAHSIEVEWPNDNANFEIAPQNVTIPSNNAVQFECRFRPTEPRKLYFRSFVAQVYWIYEKGVSDVDNLIIVPLNCEIKIQGHSFPEAESWLSLVEVVPEVVTLPPCLPGHKVNGTFKLQNKGHLPVAYRMVGPTHSNITVKPAIGKVKTFDIIAVQLLTEVNKTKNYVEEWKLIINGREEKAISIYIQSEVSVPTVEIGKENRISMGNIQEGTLRDTLVPFKNKSCFNLKYTLNLADKLTKFMQLSPLEGEISPFQQIILRLTCLGSECAPNIQNFVCSVQVIENQGAVTGENFDTIVQVEVETSYSELCSTPSYQDFGLQFYKSILTAEFDAYNFGQTDVFFAIDGEEIEGQCRNHFKVIPKEGHVSPGGSVHFRIEGPVLMIGQQIIVFSYKNRIDRSTGVSRGQKVKLFQVSYECELPELQVEAIVEHSFGRLFGKHHFTVFLEIQEFNHILKNLEVDQTTALKLRLPECEEGSKIYTITLALKNTSKLEENINIKRKKICECALKETPNSGFHQRKKDFDCPHRDMLKIETTDNKFSPGQTQFLTISVKYRIPLQSELCYVLELSHKRTVELDFQIFSIPNNTWKVSCYTPGFLMEAESIFLGTRVAPVQMFWVYNNTKNLVNYDIQTDELNRLCRINGFKVMECMKTEGQLLPYNSEPLLFKFHPIEVKTYDFLTQISFQMSEDSQHSQDFQILGKGVMSKTTQQNFTKQTTLLKSPSYCQNNPISFSQDFIEVANMPVWSIQKRLILIKNNSKRDVFEYVFGRVYIENILEITAENCYAMIKPKETHPIVIKIKTLAEPCLVTLLMPCETLNYTDMVLHQKTSEKFEEIERKLKDEFTVSEKGESPKSKNPVKIHPKPEPQTICLTISLSAFDTRDLDTFLTPEDQMRQSPQQIFQNATKGILNTYINRKRESLTFPYWTREESLDHENSLLFSRIIEEIISQYIFSKSFRKFLEICHESPNAYYSEFVMDHRKIIMEKIVESPLDKEDIAEFRRKEVLKFFNQPNLHEMAKMLEKLIYESVLSRFECCPIRNINVAEIIADIERKILYQCSGQVCQCVHDRNTE